MLLGMDVIILWACGLWEMDAVGIDILIVWACVLWQMDSLGDGRYYRLSTCALGNALSYLGGSKSC